MKLEGELEKEAEDIRRKEKHRCPTGENWNERRDGSGGGETS